MEGFKGVLVVEPANCQGNGLLPRIAFHRQAHRPGAVVGVESGALAVNGVEGFWGVGKTELDGQHADACQGLAEATLAANGPGVHHWCGGGCLLGGQDQRSGQGFDQASCFAQAAGFSHAPLQRYGYLLRLERRG